jgi:alpha-L-rhamnosidase
MVSTRILLRRDPFHHLRPRQGWGDRGRWPADWIGCPKPGGGVLEAKDAPFVIAYRLRFTVRRGDRRPIIHVSADERYELFLDGRRLGRGPERGDPRHWFFESYRLEAAPGRHALVARVWTLGRHAPRAQLTVHPGFLCAADGDWTARLATGRAGWEAKRLGGWGIASGGDAAATGARSDVDGAALDWGIEDGSGDGWQTAPAIAAAVDGAVCNNFAAIHQLLPATLPPQRSIRVGNGRIRHVDTTCGVVAPVHRTATLAQEEPRWQAFLGGGRIVVAANSRRRVIIDLGDYRCAYTELTVSGGRGAAIRVGWAEGLFEGDGTTSGGGSATAASKGDRDAIEGKRFLGDVADRFRPDGGRRRRFSTLWWQAGRYLELQIVTADQALALEDLALTATGYPLRRASSFTCDDPRWGALTRISWSTLVNCAHETFVDCPYYEQLQYVGDTRLQALVAMTWTRDDRLVRKALCQFDASRLLERGLTQACYPANVTAVIPPFSLWWVAMVHDHAAWRGDRAFTVSLMPGVRSVLESVLAHRRPDGLIAALNGWNFTDWVPAWTATTRSYRNWGVPPDGEHGASGIICWQTVWVLRQAAELETWLGEGEMAARWRRAATALARATDAAFWVPARGLYADDGARSRFSEHCQCMAVLSGEVTPARQRRIARGLAARHVDVERATIYFSHYLFDAMVRLGDVGPIFRRLDDLWHSLPATGLRTTSEEPEPSRSDCHAWGAHPLYHALASILGIRPDGLGGERVLITPRLGPLRRAAGTLAHPRGDIHVELEVRDGCQHGRVSLPPGLHGTVVVDGRRQSIAPGSSLEFQSPVR